MGFISITNGLGVSNQNKTWVLATKANTALPRADRTWPGHPLFLRICLSGRECCVPKEELALEMRARFPCPGLFLQYTASLYKETMALVPL